MHARWMVPLTEEEGVGQSQYLPGGKRLGGDGVVPGVASSEARHFSTLVPVNTHPAHSACPAPFG